MGLGSMLFVVALGTSVAAQDDGDATTAAPTDGSEIVSEEPTSNYVELPGRCEGGSTPIAPGIGIDCVFQLRPERFAELDRDADGVEDGIVDNIWAVDPVGEWHTCRVEDDVIRCPNLGETAFDPIDGFVELAIGEEYWSEAATIRTTFDAVDSETSGASGIDGDDTIDGVPPAAWLSLQGREQVTFQGLPLEFRADTNQTTSLRRLNGVEVFGIIRPRGSDTIVDRIRLDDSNAIEFDLDAGRYRIWPCVGDTVFDCAEQAAGHPFQIIDPEILPLTPDHNRPSAERINVLFVGAGLAHVGGVRSIAEEMLGLDGPVAVGVDGNPVDVDLGGEVIDLRFGPMAIEPLTSNADRFNFWFLPTDLGDELALVYDAVFNDPLSAFGMEHLQVTAIYDEALDGASDARGTSFYGRQNVPPIEAIDFGGTRVAIDPHRPILASETLAHEWGHAIFELRDEYYGFDGREVSHGYPNCAPDAATAEDWWGRRLGNVDSFAFEVAAARAEVGLDPEVWAGRLSDLVRVEVTAGGCYGNFGDATAYRPNENSLMNSEIPVFGTINRLRVETVFDRFSGRGPVTSLEDIDFACAALGDRMLCDVTLATHLDLSGEPLLVSGLRCEEGLRPPSEESLRVRCSGPRPRSAISGTATDHTVTVVLGDERVDVPVADLDPPGGQAAPSPPSTSTTLDPDGSDRPGDEATASGSNANSGSRTAGIVVIAGLVAAVSSAALIGVRSRRSHR